MYNYLFGPVQTVRGNAGNQAGLYDAEDIVSAVFRAELSAKKLLGKDKADSGKQEGNFMLGKGTHDPGLNPNAYPMTDETPYPSAVQISISDMVLGTFELPDDPADHRGILSWHAQKKDRHLHEAGSYGYLISAPISVDVLKQAQGSSGLVIQLRVSDALPGGLAIYGEQFGRYPLDPSISFVLK